jgi:hydroxymethylbilane synthase
VSCEYVGITTAGDHSADAPFADIGEAGVFTREIERALRGGDIDIAVHSLKDLETEDSEGLVLGAVLAREDPRDALLINPRVSGRSLATLPEGTRVGTASLRRRALILRQRPDLRVEHIRGNVPTRVEKLAAGEFDAIVLAVAGLNRLGLAESISEFLPTDEFPPAPGQGAVAVQVRDSDPTVEHIIAGIEDFATRIAVAAERAFLRRIEGGCQVPAGALAATADGSVVIEAMVCSPDGRSTIRSRAGGPVAHAAIVGEEAAEKALRDGADRILADIRGG